MRILLTERFRPQRHRDEQGPGLQLERAFLDRGHQVDWVRILFDPDPDTLVEQLLAIRLTEVSDTGDMLVAISAPGHLLRHHCKLLWSTEHYPWIAQAQEAPEPLLAADRQAIAEARAAYAVSPGLCHRLASFSAGDASLLAPPPGGASWDEVIGTLVSEVPQ